jgi:hypothetical protein
VTRLPAIASAALVLSLAADAREDPFVLERAFGPSTVSFPWHCAFSPDGLWAGFVDGHTHYAVVHEVATDRKVWSRTGATSCHGLAFTPDSKRLLLVLDGAFVIVALDAGAWREERNIPLGLA